MKRAQAQKIIMSVMKHRIQSLVKMLPPMDIILDPRLLLLMMKRTKVKKPKTMVNPKSQRRIPKMRKNTRRQSHPVL